MVKAATPAHILRKRTLWFAVLMSLCTVNIVIAAMLLVNRVPAHLILGKWLLSFSVAWPLVLGCILTIAPWLTRKIEQYVN